MSAYLLSTVMAAALCAWQSSCSTVSYYGQAVTGQVRILTQQKPIEELLKDDKMEPGRAAKLRLVLKLREFAASELGLPSGRSYGSYADLGREHVVWSVFAAPEFSLQPKTWFYPVVGSLDYRGYFEEEDAKRCADQLRSKGYDVFVTGVDAYSTLGWLSDPALNTFIDYDDTDLAELIFHELTHRRVYRTGETAFNEALATTVAQEGVMRWLRSIGRRDALRNYQSRLERISTIYEEIATTRKSLEFLFREPMPPEKKRAGKRALLMAFQQRLQVLFSNWGGRAPESWLENLPNNARLNASATYYEHVPDFEAYLKNDCHDDLQRFLREMERVDVSAFLGCGKRMALR